ncbi:MAG: reprolysin-like metallopeptidase, partial [Bacteroidota bacterium]
MRCLLLLLACSYALTLSAQTSPFQFGNMVVANDALTNVWTVDVAIDELAKIARKAPPEFQGQKSKAVVQLPLPSGDFAEFSIYNSPVLSNHPELGSYKLVGPWGSGRMAVSATKISVVALGPKGYFVVDALPETPGKYQVSQLSDFMDVDLGGILSCGAPTNNGPQFYGNSNVNNISVENAGAKNRQKAGNVAQPLRVYDLAVTCTGEFGTTFGGTRELVRDAFNVVFNAINTVYENELGIRLLLIDQPGLIYLDGDTDPYANPTSTGGLLGQVLNAFQINNVPPTAYDIGHILTVGCDEGQGLFVAGTAATGSACMASRTQAATCVVGGNLVRTAMGTMAHEIAHQFDVSHSWSNCPPVQNQRASETAFEPGGGITIMSYSSACGNQNYFEGPERLPGENYFHVGSLEQFFFFSREGGASNCPTIIPTDNLTPEVAFDYVDDFSIPIGTPFRL